MPENKKCSKCKEVKAVDEFNKNKGEKDGFSHYCRECTSEKNRKFRESNREAVLERERKSRERNREAVRERGRKYHEENREVRRERQRKIIQETQEMTRAMATKTGRYSLEEDLVVLDNTLTAYQKAVRLGRTYRSVKGRQEALRKKASQNA